MGIFHAQNVDAILFKIGAFAVPIAIQVGRGTLVFFFQLNPARVQGRISLAVIAATVLLLLSLCEAWLVMMPNGWSWSISVSTLMLIGWVIEIMILKEIQFTTQIEFYSNPDKWKELQEFYISKAKLEEFMKTISSGQIPERLIEEEELSFNKSLETNANDAEEDEELMFEFLQSDNGEEGNGYGSLLNGTMKEKTL